MGKEEIEISMEELDQLLGSSEISSTDEDGLDEELSGEALFSEEELEKFILNKQDQEEQERYLESNLLRFCPIMRLAQEIKVFLN